LAATHHTHSYVGEESKRGRETASLRFEREEQQRALGLFVRFNWRLMRRRRRTAQWDGSIGRLLTLVQRAQIREAGRLRHAEAARCSEK
jgi:hypothetical protein